LQPRRFVVSVAGEHLLAAEKCISLEPDGVQPGQGQGPAPGEEQPQAPVQAGV